MWHLQEEATFLLRFSDLKKRLHFICPPSCGAHVSVQEGHQHLQNSVRSPNLMSFVKHRTIPKYLRKSGGCHLGKTTQDSADFESVSKPRTWAFSTHKVYLSMYSSDLEEYSSRSKNKSGLSAVCLTDSTAKTNLLTYFCSFNWNCKYPEFVWNGLIDMKNLASVFWNATQDT